jgi:hypothetical protein
MRNTSPGGADLLQTMVQAKGSDASIHPEQPIVSLLDLGERYGIAQILDAPRSRSPINAAHTAELDQVLRTAQALAQRTTSDGLIRERPLLGALLAPRLVYPRPLVQECRQQLGYDLVGLRRALLEGIRTRYPDDQLDEWERVLLAPPAPGYIADYVDPTADATDHLTIEREVATLAHVLIAKRVTPPRRLLPGRRKAQRGALAVVFSRHPI